MRQKPWICPECAFENYTDSDSCERCDFGSMGYYMKKFNAGEGVPVQGGQQKILKTVDTSCESDV